MSNEPKIVFTTPWGEANSIHTIAPDVYDFWCDGAAGWYVGPEPRAKMPALTRIGVPEVGGGQYFINHRWILPALVFHKEAATSFGEWWPGIYQVILARVVDASINQRPGDWLNRDLRAWCFTRLANIELKAE